MTDYRQLCLKYCYRIRFQFCDVPFLTLSHPQHLHFVTLMVVLKPFQKNIFHMLRRLARILWGTGGPLGGKGCFFPFITNFLIEVANQAKR